MGHNIRLYYVFDRKDYGAFLMRAHSLSYTEKYSMNVSECVLHTIVNLGTQTWAITAHKDLTLR